MLIFDKGFMYLRQNYLLPLSGYSIANKSINTNSIKLALTSHKYTSFSLDDGALVFEFDEDVLMKAQLADAWKAFIRAVVQRDSATMIYSLQPDFCPNWSTVTDYYFSFFCACTILRLSMRGNMFIDSQTSRKISDVLSDMQGEPTRFPDGNIVYSLRKSVNLGKYELAIRKTSLSTHESVWIQMKELIIEMYSHSTDKSEEKIALGTIKKILDSLGDTFPSMLRNEVNYQLQYGYLAVTKSVMPSNACREVSSAWLTNMIASDLKNKTLPARQTRFCEYTEYLYRLMINLEHEYRSMEGKNHSLWSLINDKRIKKILEPTHSYTDN